MRIVVCLLASGYISVDVAGRWPSDADLRQIAHNAAEADVELRLGEADVYQYLSRVVLGSEPLTEVFPAADSAFTLPVLITASILATFCPRDQEWREYLLRRPVLGPDRCRGGRRQVSRGSR